MKPLYKLGKPRFSSYHKIEVIDIFKRKTFLGFINYWSHSDTIKNAGQANEVVMLLNNPSELESRINLAIKKIGDKRT